MEPHARTGLSETHASIARRKVAIAYFPHPQELPLLGAIHRGYLQEEGIAVGWYRKDRALERVNDLIEGVHDVAPGLGNRVRAAIDRDADLKIVMVNWCGGQDPLVAPHLQNVDEFLALPHPRAAINSPDCTDDLLLKRRLARAGFGERGLERIEFVETWSSYARIEAFCRGQIDVGLLHPPFLFALEEMGFNVILEHDEQPMWDLMLPKRGLVFRGSYIREHRETVKSVIRAVFRSMQWIMSADAEEVKQSVIEWCNLHMQAERANAIHQKLHGVPSLRPVTPELIADRFYPYLKRSINISGVASDTQMNALGRLHSNKADVPTYEAYTDFSLAEEVKKELGL